MCTTLSDTATPVDVRRLLSRRGFMKTTAAAAAALGASGLVSRPALAATTDVGEKQEPSDPDFARVPVEAISIQLYTMRSLMGSDLDGTLAGLAEIGYRNVEHAGFHGRSASEFRAALDAHGLHCTSGHQSLPYPYDELNWRRIIDDAYILGQRYIVEPLPLMALPSLVGGFAGVQQPPPSVMWAQYAADMNKAAAIARIYGIEVGYHNHNIEFWPLPDDPSRTPFDVLVAETDPDLVHFELDIYWAWSAQADPVELLEAHPTRIRQFHVKDMNAQGGFADPGAGVIDFVRIFRVAESLDLREYTVERDDAGQNALNTARVGYEYLHDLRWPRAEVTG